MKKLLLILGVMFSLVLSSCGISSPSMTNINQNQTQVVLSKNNYRIVKTVTGESQQTYFLGIGGLSKKSLKDDAMRDMLRNADLTRSQAIINTTVTYNTSFYILVGKIKCTTSAVVIEFIDD